MSRKKNPEGNYGFREGYNTNSPYLLIGKRHAVRNVVSNVDDLLSTRRRDIAIENIGSK